MRRAAMTVNAARTGRRVAVASTAAMLALAIAGCGGGAGQGEARPGRGPASADTSPVLERDEVVSIMQHAASSVDRDVMVAVTDRRGVILGVGANFDLPAGTTCTDPNPAPGTDCHTANLAVQLARTAAFFSADQTPLTSRSVRFISGEHFPPGIQNSGAAALFGIENTNRGCSFDAARGDALFNAGKVVPRARSLAATLADLDGRPALQCQSGGGRDGCTTGIATLPGGVPIFKGIKTLADSEFQGGRMAGGIGVAVRGIVPPPDPVAAFDSDAVLRRQDGDSDLDVGEFAARAFTGDEAKRFVPTLARKGITNICLDTEIPAPACCSAAEPCSFSILPLPVDRDPVFDPVIFIDGIEVLELADNPPVDENVSPVPGRQLRFILDPARAAQSGRVAGGYLVGPQAAIAAPVGAPPLTAEEVDAIVQAALETAFETRAGIRLPLEERTAMMIAVSDTGGNLLAVFRMDDATVFSIDVAVAKSRNVVWFSNPNIDVVDTLDTPGIGDVRGEAFPPGTAITNRTLSFGAQPFFPSGIDGSDPGPFRRVFLEDSATPCTNGREPANGRQNGIVFFPGSAPLYRDGVMIGGLGISGDGVEQDDIVTNGGANALTGFEPPSGIRADQLKVRDVRLPYLKFNRQPNQ
jgi:uncharacterized protein GlcG (DUF336 family)